MRVWIDLANSPHPLLFEPVARRLTAEGHEVLISARDHAQTVALARRRWPDLEVIGGDSPRERVGKLQRIAGRIAALHRWGAGRDLDVALSHNSYAQLAAAYSLDIPAVTAMDYEHQPANHLAFRAATTVLVPELLPLQTARRQGARRGKVVRYPGLKEELYLGEFTPDPRILERLGLARPSVLVVVRTPPSRAIYHAATHRLFDRSLAALGERSDLVSVVLARHPEQAAAIRALELGNCVVPQSVVDSRSLLYAADAMVGAGGTMTREAALLGIPTWSLFAGRIPAVERWLEGEGRLRRVVEPGQLARLVPRRSEPVAPATLRRRGDALTRLFVDATIAAGERRGKVRATGMRRGAVPPRAPTSNGA